MVRRWIANVSRLYISKYGLPEAHRQHHASLCWQHVGKESDYRSTPPQLTPNVRHFKKILNEIEPDKMRIRCIFQEIPLLHDQPTRDRSKLEKIKVVIDMERPKTQKDIQSLTRCVAALAGFISKATDKCAPFFKAFKGSKEHITWTAKCDFAFQELKDYTSKAPFLSKPLPGEVIFLYISISHTVVSSVLIQKPETAKLPIFYVKHSRMLSFSTFPSSNWLSLLSSQRASSPLFLGSYYHRPN